MAASACPAERGREADGRAAAPQPDGAATDRAASGARSEAAGWVYVKAGDFLVGSPPDEPGRMDLETRHVVKLTTDFLMQPTEVTQEQFEKVLGYNPSRFRKCGPSCPVEEVSWHEATAYCNRLSEAEGLRACYLCTGSGKGVRCHRDGYYRSLFECPAYRLPAEAEWEYAARAGENRATPHGTPTPEQLECEPAKALLDDVAWFCGNSEGRTHPVAQKQKNALGLYDMLGNVWEWNHDWDHLFHDKALTDPWGPMAGLSRLGHGGSWLNDGRFVRFAARGGGTPDRGYGFLGFRPVRSCLGAGPASLCPSPGDGGPAPPGAEAGPSKAPSGPGSAGRRSSRLGDNRTVLVAVAVGVLLLFALERLLRWQRRRRAGRDQERRPSS